MRYLIDGYNLMHAKGLMTHISGPDGLRRARRRFLAELHAKLGPMDAASTTVVFDAANPPPDRPRMEMHKGMRVLYAVGDENADARLEALIARESTPKVLTVVSSDRRIRIAAKRRGAKIVQADEFWGRAGRPASSPPRQPDPPRDCPKTSDDREAAAWREEFAEADLLLAADGPGSPNGFSPTPDEVDQIAREVASESLFFRPRRRR